MPRRRPNTHVSRYLFAQQNTEKKCIARGCDRPRRWTSRCCSTHVNRQARYGHYDGGPLDKSMVREWRSTMREFLTGYRETSPQIGLALDFTRNLLDSHFTSRKSCAERELRRLRGHGVTAEEALEIMGAVWLVAMSNPRTLPDDDRLTFALAGELFRCRPLDQRVPRSSLASGGEAKAYCRLPVGSAKRDVGSVVRKALGAFFLQIWKRIEADHEEKLLREATLRSEFVPVPLPVADDPPQ